MNLVVSESHFVCFGGAACVCEISNTHTHTLKSTGISKEGGWDPAAVYGENLSLMFLRFIYVVGLHTHIIAHISLL